MAEAADVCVPRRALEASRISVNALLRLPILTTRLVRKCRVGPLPAATADAAGRPMQLAPPEPTANSAARPQYQEWHEGDRLLYAGNDLEKAHKLLADAIKHRPRIRLTVLQRTRVLEQ